MTLKPTGNNVHLQPNPMRTSAGRIVLIEGDPRDCRTFFVLAVGPKVKEIKAGDNVYTPLWFQHTTLEDGTKIADAAQCQLVVTLQPV